MPSTVVDRDEQAQKKFGETMINFEAEMKACCSSMKGHIEEARDNIQADNARGALEYILELIEQIESELPGTEEFGTRQKVLAKHIEDAGNFRFTRR